MISSGRQVRARVAVLISGRGSNMLALARAMQAQDYPADLVAVLSDRAEADGLKSATDRGIPAQALPRASFASKAAHEAAMIEALQRVAPDIICLAGYMRVLSPAMLAAFQGRIINIHPSLLPAFPGLDTHARALASGTRVHGASVHFVTEGVDEGPVIAQVAVPVMPDDDPDRLAARVLTGEHRLYPLALAMLARGEVRLDKGKARFSRSDNSIRSQMLLIA